MNFGHPRSTLANWSQRVRAARRAGAKTPFYCFASAPVAKAYQHLAQLEFGRPAVHWLSAKTQPLPELWNWWQQRGGGIEVVSEMEFRLALKVGYSVDQILVNGPAKARWLPNLSGPRLRVNFDSVAELEALLPRARREHWRLGLRIRTAAETDPGPPVVPTQFGMEPEAVAAALARLRRAKLDAETVHFHLRTNVPHAREYATAVEGVAEVCRSLAWNPRHLDLGGGLPPPYTLDLKGRRFDADFDLEAFARGVRHAVNGVPSVAEVWLENGRFVSAGSGVLVVQVLEIKDRGGVRQLICDGGRTLNALVSTWEEHELQVLEPRQGRRRTTAVYGPTCMAFDRLALRPLPASVRVGDHLIWFEAGAYHLPWETRFSHELAEIWWEDEDGLRCVRSSPGQRCVG